MANIISKIKTSNTDHGIRAGYMYYGTTTGTESALAVTIKENGGNTISIPELVKGMTFALTFHLVPSTSATLSVNGLTGKPIHYDNGLTGKQWVVGETYVFIYNGTAFVAISSYDDYTVTVTGSGNAITNISKSGRSITATKGSTFLTAHPTISKSTDTTSTQSVAHQGSFTVIDSVTRDGNGHVTKVNTKTVTLPSDVGETNQNAFSNVVVGSTTIAADSKTDTLTLVAGNNITLTPDATNDKITITATDTTYSAATTSAAGLMSASDKSKLNGIASGAEVNVQSDWNETTTTSDAYIKNKPSSLKNPKSLTIGSKSYDGSTAVSISAQDLGLDSALKYCGVTTTKLADGATTNPIVINNNNHTATTGCVVFYSTKEFVFDGTKWTELGDGSNHKIKQTAVASPSASGSTTAFIDTISQDENGKITATKKNVTFPTIPTVGDGKVTVNQAGKQIATFTMNQSGDTVIDLTDNNTTYTSLKNPYSLTIQGNGTNIASYDGSSAVTANIPAASTSAYGVTKLSDAVNSTSTTLAATANAVKKAYDLANGKTANTGTVTSITPGTGLTGTSSDTAITTSGTINLKTASSDEIGGIKIGYTQSGKNYPIQLDSNNKAYVNVPWTDNNTTYSFVNNNPTLAWSTKSTIGTVGGVELTVNMPANPNSDTKVTAVGNHYTPSGGSAATATASGSTLSFGGAVITGVTKDAAGHVTGVTTSKLPANPNSDTKNTAGSTDTSSKIFLIGATSQAANPQTYSHDTAYVGTDGCLYSNNTKVSVDGHTHNYAGSSSAGGSATSADKLTTTRSIAISGGATGTATNFNGTSNISIPVTGVSEAYLTWGGKNHTGDYGPIDAAMISELGANRMAFTPAQNINVEYSQNGGSTWKTYSKTNSEKIGLLSVIGSGQFSIGGSTATGVDKSKYKLRITVNTANVIYTVLNKFMIYCSTNGSTGAYCTISGRLQTNVESNTETWQTFANQIPITGWSGYNIINTNGITTYGNQKASQYGQLRFEFGVTSHSSSSQYSGLFVINIFGYGGVGWTCPSTMAKTGHLYSYDASQNATFPGQINAYSDISLSNSTDTTPKLRFVRKTKTDDYYDYYLYSKTNGSASNLIFGYSSNGTDYDISTFDTSGNYSGNAATATTASKLGTANKGSATNPIYLSQGVPTACTYKLEANVPSTAVFTDTDTKVTSAANHYSPSTDTGSALSVDASSSTAATWGTTQLVTGVNISRDSKGHVTGLTVDSIKMPANPNSDTHYKSLNIVGASATATANATATNGNVYLNHVENGSVTSKHNIVGTGATTVVSDGSGNIVINSPSVGETNQNAFSNVVVGSTTIVADSKTDTLTLVAGSNITLTPDATNDKITIAATDTNTHNLSKNIIGAKNATANSSQVNGGVYLTHVENSEVTSSHQITGSGGTTVKCDSSGNIVISSGTIPTIPTVGNATVTIKQNNSNKGSFTLNQTSAATINLTDTIFNPSERLRVSGQFLHDPNNELQTFTCDGDVENPYVTFSLTDAGEGEKLIHGRQLQLVGESGVNIRGNTEGKIFFNVEGSVGEQGPRGYQGYQGYQGAAGKNGTGTQGYQGYKGDSSPNAMTYNNKTTNCNANLTWTITGATRTYTAFNGGGTIAISGTPTQGVEHYLLIHNCGGEDATGVVTFSTSLGNLIAKSATIKVPADSYVEVSVVYLQSATFTGQAKATLVLTCSDVMTKVN